MDKAIEGRVKLGPNELYETVLEATGDEDLAQQYFTLQAKRDMDDRRERS